MTARRSAYVVGSTASVSRLAATAGIDHRSGTRALHRRNGHGFALSKQFARRF
jgi:hypothetical protein